jgi:thymidylate synthase (FAD)
MRLIKPSVELLCFSTDALQLIETAGRTCYKSEGKITSGSTEIFIRMVLMHGHESVIEHAVATVRFICDRGVTHEIVRHRLASYSQESTRYCDYSGGHITFIIPPWIQCIEPGIYDAFKNIPNKMANEWLWILWNCEKSYKNLREQGWKPEQARSVLPNSLKTEIVMTANLREWRHFFKLRTPTTAHPQMREVVIPLLEDMKKHIPIIFDDIIIP